ncbi:GNAT family N-acetyltransferase [Celeribacter litoreus]|uniref:GNAT family N-acetyltransferase n=1 Tax=Celeribacter litoreus TaxID=2876714 RepID=UPI001CCD2B39|nr:GNAT family N-acetyltransferase [Celeribacter litoreus]MCA0043040.1 GNAT family N-acetyltransferase [Celeribacter litoreus]
MTLTLTPLPRDALPRVAGFSLPEDQAGFADLPTVTMATGAARDGHMILFGQTPVGFFAIDRDYAQTHEFAQEGSIGLRQFLIDHPHQGRGHAGSACLALSPYLRHHYPQAIDCYLTVNCRNPNARAAYLKGGFEDTGALYLDGGFGPQHILQLDLIT